jgi:hypothetical protein
MNNVEVMNKVEVLNRILNMWEKYPSQRLGQIISNACNGDPFYVSDKDLVANLENLVCKANSFGTKGVQAHKRA